MVETSQSPVKSDPFVPRRWLRGGHLQTVASFLLPRRFNLPAPEERYIEVAPGVQILCHCHWQSDRTKPLTIIIVHGLEGSSESQYALGVTAKALAAGMNVIRYNQRNCGGTDALAPVLYHSGLSDDVAAVAREVIERDRISQLALVGFSMGGNLVLKLAGVGIARPAAVSRGRRLLSVDGSGGVGGCVARTRQPPLRVVFSFQPAASDGPQSQPVSRTLRRQS